MEIDKNAERSLKQDMRSIRRLLQRVHSLAPGAIATSFSSALCEALAPFLGIFFSTAILDELLTRQDPQRLGVLVGCAIVLQLLLSLLRSGLDKLWKHFSMLIYLRFQQALAQSSMRMDYRHIEDPRTHQIRQLANEASSMMGGIDYFIRYLGRVLQDAIALCITSGVMLQFFSLPARDGSTGLMRFIDSPTASLLLLAFMLAAVILNMTINRWSGRLRQQRSLDNLFINRKSTYYSEHLIDNYQFGKDVRLYHMAPMLCEELQHANDHMLSTYLRYLGKELRLQNLGQLFSAFVSCFAYILIALKALIGSIAISGFTLYSGTIHQFSQALQGLATKLTDLRMRLFYSDCWLAYLDLQQRDHHIGSALPQADAQGYRIEFRNVSFRYPGSEEMMLKNINLTLRSGERLAVVGMNGAGKTTFIKLLCRFYDPDEGEILLNGTDIRDIDIQAYLELFSVVFQDFRLFAFPLDQNVAASMRVDDKKVMRQLDRADVGERVRRMPQGAHTYLYKNFEENGVEISGGEAQKIGIARALYKDAPFVVLDEPTAALDPLSEYEIYSSFDELIGNKAAIYISHRLSSCRFCHRIAVFHQGRIVQLGSHEELLDDPDGKYAELWNAQAQYYQHESPSA